MQNIFDQPQYEHEYVAIFKNILKPFLGVCANKAIKPGESPPTWRHAQQELAMIIILIGTELNLQQNSDEKKKNLSSSRHRAEVPDGGKPEKRAAVLALATGWQ